MTWPGFGLVSRGFTGGLMILTRPPIFFTTLSAVADDCRATDLIFLDQLQLQRVVDLQDVLQLGQQLDGVDSGKIALVVLVTSVAVVDDLFSDGIGVVVEVTDVANRPTESILNKLLLRSKIQRLNPATPEANITL